MQKKPENMLVNKLIKKRKNISWKILFPSLILIHKTKKNHILFVHNYCVSILCKNQKNKTKKKENKKIKHKNYINVFLNHRFLANNN